MKSNINISRIKYNNNYYNDKIVFTSGLLVQQMKNVINVIGVEEIE